MMRFTGVVNVPSTEKLDKFTNLSTNNITIYRINNPDVLKTVTNYRRPVQPILFTSTWTTLLTDTLSNSLTI